MNRLALLLLLALALPAPAAAQPTAPDPRKGERLDGRSVPEDPFRTPRAIGRAILVIPRVIADVVLWPVVRVAAFAERNHVVQRAYWAFTSEDGLLGLRPEARYETGLVASLGVRFFDRRSLGRGSLIDLRLRTGGPRFISGELRLRAPPLGLLSVELRTAFARNENQLFAGIGGERSDALAEAGRGQAKYGGDRASSAALATVEATGALRLTGSLELDVRAYRSSASLDRLFCAAPETPGCVTVDDALVPGFKEGLRVVRAGADLLLDTRAGRRSRAGLRLELASTVVAGILGDPSRHLRVVADAQLILDLDDRALILRLDAGHVSRLGDAPIPFEELLSPSGTDGLRGLSSGRLRGESQLFGSLEYRWLVAPYLDAALWIEDGNAFGPRFEGLSLGRMIPGWGVGLRAHEIRADYWNAGPLFYIQLGHSPGEGARLMVGLGGGS